MTTWAEIQAMSPKARASAYAEATDAQRSIWREEASRHTPLTLSEGYAVVAYRACLAGRADSNQQRSVASALILANGLKGELLGALNGILSNPGGRCTPEQWQAGLRAVAKAEARS